jgi:broad specificity phosphatase PhoE
MLTVLYSPHMTSLDNEARRASGHADVPLSPLGRQQAQELGQHYASTALDAIFCSDLQRAMTTAQLAFAGRDVPLVPDARLRECNYGDLTRAPVAQVEEEFPRRIREPFPHGESVLMVVERVGAFLYDALQHYDGKTIVVIGHWATRYGLEYWCGGAALDEIVHRPWKWRALPIWRYELSAHTLSERQDHIPKPGHGRG